MIFDEIKENLKEIQPLISLIKEFWKNSSLEQKFQELHTQSLQENFWQQKNNAEILQELQHIKSKRKTYHEIINSFEEINELIELFKEDEQELQNIFKETKKLAKATRSFKISLLLQDEHDNANCFFTINSGAGGTESQDWANMLLRMFLRFCERYNFNASIIEQQNGDEAGIKSATLHIKGRNAYGFLKAEHGVHRLVRISPFDSNKRRHTSFAAVTVTPELPPSKKIDIEKSDLRIDTYRASGAGGQHVNKTDSAVRITHLPTNIVVQCQNERSQTQNKETAMKMLMAKLQQKQELEDKSKTQVDKSKNEWGSQIRSYVLHPYKMVKDHRSNLENPQPDLVLDGDIMDFIENFLLINQ